MNPRVDYLDNYTSGSDTIYTIETPVNSSPTVYPSDTICFFELGKR